MPKVCITHGIAEVDRWLAGHAEREAVFRDGSGVTDFVAMDGSKQAAVVVDVDDLNALQELLSSMPPDVAAQAQSHGVDMATFVVYVEAPATS